MSTSALIQFRSFKLQRVLEGSGYFKVREYIQIKLENLVIFSFQITTIVIYSLIQGRNNSAVGESRLKTCFSRPERNFHRIRKLARKY